MQVSRDNNLKIPKKVLVNVTDVNSVDDEVSVQMALSMAKDKKIDEKESIKAIEKRDKDLEMVVNFPSNSNDLVVITVVKKLGAYIITVTEKSPKKFRGVFVNRMQNYCLETLEYLLQANFIRLDCIDNKRKREYYQKEAIIKLKLLGYISMVAQQSNCILLKQYKQISSQIAQAINLTVAWKKSDDKRWNNK